MSTNLEFQLDDITTSLEQKFTLPKNATIEHFALKLHVFNDPDGNFNLEIKNGANVIETITLTSDIINTKVLAQLGVAQPYKVGYFLFTPTFPINLRRDVEYTLRLATTDYIFSAASSIAWVKEYVNETNLLSGLPENDLGKVLSYRLHGFKEYGGFIMPRTSTFLDGQQSPTQPDLGSLNRQVTGSQGAPIGITAAGGITIADVPVEMMFIEGDPGNVDISVDPQISPGTVIGQELGIYGTNNAKKVLLEDGNGIDMDGAIEIDAETNITLLWTGTVWKHER